MCEIGFWCEKPRRTLSSPINVRFHSMTPLLSVIYYYCCCCCLLASFFFNEDYLINRYGDSRWETRAINFFFHEIWIHILACVRDLNIESKMRAFSFDDRFSQWHYNLFSFPSHFPPNPSACANMGFFRISHFTGLLCLFIYIWKTINKAYILFWEKVFWYLPTTKCIPHTK